MRKRILCILLTAVMLLTLIPITVLAGEADSFVITNNTPESDKAKNHGYIAVDKTSAESGATITTTIVPDKGYQLKSLTCVELLAPENFIDLGIKDANGKSLYWAVRNLGATDPQDYGDYFAWGETETYYNTTGGWQVPTYWKSGKTNGYAYQSYCGQSSFTEWSTPPYDIDTKILKPSFDAASNVNPNWRTPTKDEFDSLKSNCYCEWTQEYNGTSIAGLIFYKAKADADKGKLGNISGYTLSDVHIFLPAGGRVSGKNLSYVGSEGEYWSSSLGTSDSSAYIFSFNSNMASTMTYYRIYGGTIRPVTTESSSISLTPVKQADGTYQFTMPSYPVIITAEFEEKTLTIADILPDDFPTSTAGAWLNAATGGKSYIMNGNLFVYGQTNVELSKSVTKKGDGNYEYQGTSGTIITFVMESGKLTEINVSGSVYPINNGTYVASHVHTFTYDANGSVITATCTDGCSGGYDDNPLTLTLTAPSSLVYDGNAKAFTFADGETDAWTTAGLQLPTITYTAKSGSSLTNDKAINAGSYTASITVDTNKTASLDFEITKATPYIKTTPAPNDIEYGEKLLDSTLFGGYVQASSTDSTQVGGLFEWAEPNTMPAISDSDVTLYDVTFTPADETNYNTVSCKVTITVNHTHNPVLVNGQAPTEEASGWKDYYECICGEFYEDATGNVKIPDLDAWKAEGGNGYIAKLEPTPDPINYKVIEGANSVWAVSAGESPVFRSNADFSKFSHVLLDGKELAKKYYKAESGSTLITLTPEFTATLAVGKHTIEIVSTDGSAATVFYIEETIAQTDGEGFALSTAATSIAFIGCNIAGLAVVFFVLKKKKVR